MEPVPEIIDGAHLLLGQLVGLELLDPSLLVLHPQDSFPVEIKWDEDFCGLELPVGPNLVMLDVNFVQVRLLELQLSRYIIAHLRSDSLFWVGNAQKMTSFRPYIIVIE